MANTGVAPLDPTTDVGKLRALIGDTNYVPLDPPVTGQGDYTMFSDVELTAYLAQAGDSLNRAAGYAYFALASQAALSAKQIKDYDLQVDTRQRADSLFNVAKWYFDQADAADAEEAFFIVPTGRRREPWAELAERPCGCRGACYCGGW
jgi:hypothetical protein